MASRKFAQLRSGMAGGLLCSLLLASCASSYDSAAVSGNAAPQVAESLELEASADLAPGPGTAKEAQGETIPVVPGSPSQAKPQLIKRAELSLIVADTGAAIQAIAQLMAQEQGDILNLSESRYSGERRSANLSLRVPQQRLDVSLEKLASLGEVENRSISAEDVSGQIVDTDARLRNLRKQEEMILKIMEQSGEISDVLAVSQELANVRQSIEQIDAQLKLLQSQVAYSTINLAVTEPATFSAPARTKFTTELTNTWAGATDSVLGFSRGLVKLGLVLLVWSPYLGILALLIWGAKRGLRNRRDRRAALKATAE